MKVTKKALRDFIQWSTSRYNDYCGYGTKAENVDIVYNSLNAGHYVGFGNRADESKTVFKIQCAQGAGENGNGRHWRVKGGASDYEYEIDCINKTITGLNSKRVLQFHESGIAIKPIDL